MNRRRQQLVTLPDGRVVDEAALRSWLAEMDRRNERVTVARLSETDAACQAMARGRTRRPLDDDSWPYVTRRQWLGYFLIAVALVVGAYVITVAAIVSVP